MVFIHKSGVRFSVGAPQAPVVQLDRIAVFETAGWRFESSRVHQISSGMRYLFLLLFLISCSKHDCAINPGVTVQQKEIVKNNTEIIKTESKTIIEQLQDVKENLRPSGQLRCSF